MESRMETECATVITGFDVTMGPVLMSMSVNPCKTYSSAGPAVLYFSGNSEIRSREINSDHYALITDDDKKVKQAIGVAFDPTASRIYWADVKLQVVASTNLDGMDYQTWHHDNIEKPEFVAI